MSDEIAGLNERWIRAWFERDAGTIEALAAPRYTYIAPSGQILGRDAILDIIRSPTYRLHQGGRREVATVPLGEDSVLVQHRWQGQGEFEGQTFTDDQCCTMVWRRLEGGWQVVLETCASLCPSPEELRALLGGIDIYLLDQLMKGRLAPRMAVLDAGCGNGRNVAYLMHAGFDVWAVDREEASVEQVRRLAKQVAPHLEPSRFRLEDLEHLSFADGMFDVVLSNAVLHFARDHAGFATMVSELWRVLRPGGMLFVRLASSIGLPGRSRPAGEGRYELPDGSVRYLVDQALLLTLTATLGGRLLEPLKTTVVQDQRSMTTWCVEKPSRAGA